MEADNGRASPVEMSYTYVVVLRAASAARFLPEEGWEIRLDIPAVALIDVRVRTFTRWVGTGKEAIPRELIVEVTLEGKTIDDAIVKAGEIARSLATMAAFVANVYVGTIEVHLVYEQHPRGTEREFLEVFLADETGTPSEGRIISRHLLETAGRAFFELPPKPAARVDRALRQYELALRQWRLGGEYLALAHLWIAAEALTPAVMGKVADDRGASLEDLARTFGVDPDDPERPRWRDALGAKIRRQVIFGSDDDTYSAAREASNGLEHGFMEFSDIVARAVASADATFGYIRRAIIDLLRIPEEAAFELLEIRVRDAQSRRKVIRGSLLGTAPDPAQEGELYPRLEWASTVSEVIREGAKFSFVAQDRITVRTHPDVGFRADRVEVRGRLEDGQAPVELSPEEMRFEATPHSRATDLLNAVVPVADAAASSASGDAMTRLAQAALQLFGQGLALYQSCQALIAAQLPVEALVPLRPLTIAAARFEQMTDAGGPGLGLLLRLQMESIERFPLDEESTKALRADLESAAEAAGIGLPASLPDVTDSAVYRNLGAEMAFAQGVSEADFSGVGLHIVQVADDRQAFMTRLAPGPLTDMVASAAVIAMLQLVKDASRLLDWTIDESAIDAQLGEAREINDAAAAENLRPPPQTVT